MNADYGTKEELEIAEKVVRRMNNAAAYGHDPDLCRATNVVVAHVVLALKDLRKPGAKQC